MQHSLKVGDEIKVVDTDTKTRTITAIGETRVLYKVQDCRMEHTALIRHVIKVEPFFEVGKLYRNDEGDMFDVVAVSERNGQRVAFGWLTWPDCTPRDTTMAIMGNFRPIN